MNSLCRACMCVIVTDALTSPMRYHIFETINFAEKLEKCCGRGFNPFEHYSVWICKKCYEQVIDFWKFQEMCRRSIEKFDEMIKHETKSKSTVDVIEMVTCTAVPVEDILAEEITIANPLEISDKVVNAMVEIEETCRTNEINDSLKTPQDISEKKVDDEHPILKMRCKSKAKEILDREDLYPANNKIECNEEVPSISDSEAKSPVKTFNSRLALKCNSCPKQFTAKHSLDAHQRKHEGLPPYPCTHDNCDSSFNRWHHYQEHLKQHTASQDLHKCEINHCERVYKNKSALNIHKRKYHNCGPELKTHMCEICGKVFKSSAVLNDHRFTHVERSQLPYICEEPGCTKRFSNKEKLKIHKMRHAGIKNFICPHCGMRKTTRNELKIHINYHTLERTWACRFCAKVCNSAGNLKMHVRNIHERAKDFACRYCDRTFAKADTKKYHEMTHTGEKPHACDVCGRRFLQPAALRTHRKTHLKDNAKSGTKAKGKIITTNVENISVESTVFHSLEHEQN